MENIINVPFKRKNTVDSDIFVVDRIEGDFVIFKNNARCLLTVLQTDFELANNIQTNESTIVDPIINPETFFNTPINDDDLLNKVELAAKNPNALPTNSDKLQEAKTNPNSNLLARLDDDSDMNHQNINTENIQPINAEKTNRLPEWDVFDRVKKVEEIEILVPFKIKLPRPEKIDALNDMFETSFTMYLSKQYIKENVVNNSVVLQKMIQLEIENWMDSELYGNKKKRATNKKSTKTVKPQVEEKIEEVKVKEIKVDEDKSEESALTFFNQNVPAWDGNLKKLFIINTEEQYNAVSKEIDRLKTNKPNSSEIDKYQDMIETYLENKEK